MAGALAADGRLALPVLLAARPYNGRSRGMLAAARATRAAFLRLCGRRWVAALLPAPSSAALARASGIAASPRRAAPAGAAVLARLAASGSRRAARALSPAVAVAPLRAPCRSRCAMLPLPPGCPGACGGSPLPLCWSSRLASCPPRSPAGALAPAALGGSRPRPSGSGFSALRRAGLLRVVQLLPQLHAPLQGCNHAPIRYLVRQICSAHQAREPPKRAALSLS